MTKLELHTRLLERYGSRVLRPIVYQSTREHLARIAETESPSDGIYYCILSPNGTWNLSSYRFDEMPEKDHDKYWEDFVAPLVAYQWAARLKRDPEQLAQALQSNYFGFPRGRIGKDGGRFFVRHGNDTPVGITKEQIRRAFTLPTSAEWEFDTHERCQPEDRDIIRRLLRLKQTWSATGHEELDWS